MPVAGIGIHVRCCLTLGHRGVRLTLNSKQATSGLEPVLRLADKEAAEHSVKAPRGSIASSRCTSASLTTKDRINNPTAGRCLQGTTTLAAASKSPHGELRESINSKDALKFATIDLNICASV